jgi:hypothetical protein
MSLESLRHRLEEISKRARRPRNAATLTTPEIRARLADALGLSEAALAELAAECRAAGISMSDFLRASYGGMVQP